MMTDFFMEADGGNSGANDSSNNNAMNGDFFWNSTASAQTPSVTPPATANEEKSEVSNALDSFQAEQQSFQLGGISADADASSANEKTPPSSQPLYQTTLGGSSSGWVLSEPFGSTTTTASDTQQQTQHQQQPQQYYYIQQQPSAPGPSPVAPAPVAQQSQPQLVPSQYYATTTTPVGAPLGAPGTNAAPASGPISEPTPGSFPNPAPAPMAAAPGSVAAAPGTVIQQLPAGSYVLAAPTTTATQQTIAPSTATSSVLQPTGIVTSAATPVNTVALPVLSSVPPIVVPPPPVVRSSPKKKFPMKPIPKNLPPEEKQRFERNLREQQRSFQISQQIKELREVLTAANIPLNSNKYSILLAAGEYIKQLQARAIMNEAEHRKMVATLQQTNECIQNPQLLQPEQVVTNEGKENDEEQLFVHGLDYKAVFHQNPSAALSIVGLDGRFLECNTEFENVSGLTRDQLRRQTLFNMLQDQKQVFEAMAAMLQSGSTGGRDAQSGNSVNVSSPLYWSGLVSGRQNPHLKMNITLAKSSDGSPRFFNCALTAAT